MSCAPPPPKMGTHLPACSCILSLCMQQRAQLCGALNPACYSNGAPHPAHVRGRRSFHASARGAAIGGFEGRALLVMRQLEVLQVLFEIVVVHLAINLGRRFGS